MSHRPVQIRANTVLPARREPVTLRTADGLTLVGELALPASRPPVATLVTLHPLPTHGGSMDSHVLRKASYRLPALADVAVLRFNTRGTASPAGVSEGAFDAAEGERHDVAAALSFAVETGLPERWLLGWSFGSDLVLRHGPDQRLRGVVVVSPPLRYTTDEDLDAWAGADLPVVALVPELDDYLRPAEARRRFARIPHAQVRAFEGAKHLWVGERAVGEVLDAVVDVVAPGRGPLARTWDNPSGLATVDP
ncbi:MAG: alpha/beta hydrolase [Actinomycetota bacterium]|nr:alpha/beta hydrolase [Actinomycetota bacterium]